MVMARELYTLLTGQNNPFCVPVNPGAVAIYTRPVVTGQQVDLSPLSRTEQATIDTQFARQKHYFLSMQNIEHACFTVLDANINDAFKVSTDPTIRGWHAGMSVRDILDQLSSFYGQPTPHCLSRCVFGSRCSRGAILVKSQSLAAIHTPIVNFCRMQFASSSPRGFMSERLKNGIACSPRRRRGSHYEQ